MLKRRRKMPRRKYSSTPLSPFWTYCALASLIGAFVTFNFVYSRKRTRYIQMQKAMESGGSGSAGSALLRGAIPRERWISTDAQAFVRLA